MANGAEMAASFDKTSNNDHDCHAATDYDVDKIDPLAECPHSRDKGINKRNSIPFVNLRKQAQDEAATVEKEWLTLRAYVATHGQAIAKRWNK